MTDKYLVELKKKYNDALMVEYDMLETKGPDFMEYEDFNDKEGERLINDIVDEVHKLSTNRVLERMRLKEKETLINGNESMRYGYNQVVDELNELIEKEKVK